MTDFSNPLEQPPVPDTPIPAQQGEPYSSPGETPMTAHSLEPVLVEGPSARQDTPMTAQGWEASEEYEPATEEDTDYLNPDRDSADRRVQIMQTAAWLGPRLSELGHPPTGAALIDTGSDVAPPDQGTDDLLHEMSKGWVVTMGMVPAPPAESVAPDQPAGAQPDRSQWAGAVMLLPRGELAGIDTSLPEASQGWTISKDSFVFSMADPSVLGVSDRLIESAPGAAEQHLSYTLFSSLTVTRGLNTLLNSVAHRIDPAQAEAWRAELRARFQQADQD